MADKELEPVKTPADAEVWNESNYSKGKKRKKVFLVIKLTLLFILLFGSILAMLSAIWCMTTWSELDLNELVYHLRAPLKGAGNSMIGLFVVKALVPAIIISAVIIALYFLLRNINRFVMRMTLLLSSIAILLGTLIRFGDWIGVVPFIRNMLVTSTFVDDHYVNPAKVELTFPSDRDPSVKDRNVIVLFLESTEVTFLSKDQGGAFDLKDKNGVSQSVMPNLYDLVKVKGAEDFGDYSSPALNGSYQIPGSGWTMGSIFTQTSGIPLSVPLFVGENSMNTQESFFSSATTFTDILHKHNYIQGFTCGSDVEFGGRALYFKNHGFDFDNGDFFDDYISRVNSGDLPKNYSENVTKWWGFEDYKLFTYAREWLGEYANKLNNGEETRPFNYSFLTVDTHFEDGFADRLNQVDRNEDGIIDEDEYVYEEVFPNNQYANIYRANDWMVSKFVEWFYANDSTLGGHEIPDAISDNTTMILVGDHKTMDYDFCFSVPEDYIRKPYVAYINAAATRDLTPTTGVEIEWGKKNGTKEIEFDPSKPRNYSALDSLPTFLAAMGVKEGNEEIKHLGLGTNVFTNQQTLIEKYGIETVNEELMKRSQLLRDLFYGRDISNRNTGQKALLPKKLKEEQD